MCVQADGARRGEVTLIQYSFELEEWDQGLGIGFGLWGAGGGHVCLPLAFEALFGGGVVLRAVEV